MNSPFKFLDPFGPEDIKAFFGRERETQELYSLVTKNRLAFVYGPSGTGKTSLVRCGLANRFKGVDWLPLFIRRGADINQSLREAAGKALGQDTAYEGELAEALEKLFHRYLRPVYLIFDQFEELFILGDRDEQVERLPFYQTIADLLDLELPCRILFIMREDYFGHLDRFERLIPELYHRKLRVEPMSREKLQQVIVGSCQVYNIPFGDPDKDPERILDNIIRERAPVQMPFVQVYLHKLFLKAAHLQGITDSSKEPVRFDQQVIDHMGPIEKVLGYFLEDQEANIMEELAELDPPENLVRRVLDVFVSDEGTKVPIPFKLDSEGTIFLQGKAAERLALLDHQQISACLRALERNRILRRGDDQLEVAHDTLAALIDQQRTNEQRQLNEIRRRIEIGYREHLDSKGDYFFDAGQLARIEPFLDQVAIAPEWTTFLEASRQDVENKEQAERLRVQKELELAEEKLAAEQAAQEAKVKQLELAEASLKTEQVARKRQKRLTRTVAVVALLAVAASVFAFSRNTLANRQKAAAEAALCTAYGEQLQRKKLELNQANLDLARFVKAGENLYVQLLRDSIQEMQSVIQELEKSTDLCK